jgi:hypothetical protein
MYLFVVGDILLVIHSGISWVSFCRLQVFVSEIKGFFPQLYIFYFYGFENLYENLTEIGLQSLNSQKEFHKAAFLCR